ncbi:MAG TPA: NAD(P)H-dependent glycerol-3-phosphate dehydrogenase [Rhizomicrobium sp.]|nr:NAD(P)H-dependent glycerol-3-phosphate dehydrogenase [Rhizomicrobium sp.]
MIESKGKSGNYAHIGVVGAGAWGTALALVAAEAGRRVTLWAREAEVLASIRDARENTKFLPGILLPKAVAATGDMAQAAAAGALLVAVPAQHLRETLLALKPRKPVMLCAKGVERGTGKLLTEVLAECAPDAEPAILSGPSFARDVAQHLPTAVTIAARMEIAIALQAALGHGTFRPYASDDLTGVALGGAAKNVYAIGCGIVAGLGLGESARAALLARSFAELCRLGEAIGAKPETLMGLSGLGDLVLTATSPTSRNFSYGVALGKAQPHAAALAEGIDTAPALVARARRHNVELPIAEAIADILAGTLALQDAIPRLMSRPLKTE